MKRLFLAIVSVVAALVLVGCGGGDSGSSSLDLTGKWFASNTVTVNGVQTTGNITMTLAQTGANVKGIASTSTGLSYSITGTFDGKSFVGDFAPNDAGNCPRKFVLIASSNTLSGTGTTTSACSTTLTTQLTFAKQ
jgi:hypothetical protein